VTACSRSRCAACISVAPTTCAMGSGSFPTTEHDQLQRLNLRLVNTGDMPACLRPRV